MGSSTAATATAALVFAAAFVAAVYSQEAQPIDPAIESQCRPYVEKALREFGTSEYPPGDKDQQHAEPAVSSEDTDQVPKSGEADSPTETVEVSTEEVTSKEEPVASAEEGLHSTEDEAASAEEGQQREERSVPTEELGSPASAEEVTKDGAVSVEEAAASTEEEAAAASAEEEGAASAEEAAASAEEAAASAEEAAASAEEAAASAEEAAASADEEGAASAEEAAASAEEEGAASAEEEGAASAEEEGAASVEEGAASTEEGAASAEEGAASAEEGAASAEETVTSAEEGAASAEEGAASAEEGAASAEEGAASAEEGAASAEEGAASAEEGAASAEEATASAEEAAASAEEAAASAEEAAASAEEAAASAEEAAASAEEVTASAEDAAASADKAATSTEEEQKEDEKQKDGTDEKAAEDAEEKPVDIPEGKDVGPESAESEEPITEVEPIPEEELTQEMEIPEKLRPREHIAKILQLDSESAEKELMLSKVADIILRDLKRLYDNAIKPLETLYKYRDLSNRHFGDPEIFSKPLILFMGPWSGGKSSIINYLLDNEYTGTALRTGAEPSPAYFNIVMWGDRSEVLDGTQLAADWTFSGLQKFGQGLLDRLRGLRLPNKLLEKVNIVEIPGILEIRKQVERLFPFNDACQWFIDRADIIFLVYDPAKLDVGPETEAILDQLKGRESQTRIVLNKADQVKPEELMRVQGTLIWNISPLMSSSEPPVMYSTSLWSLPYELGAPVRLLQAQEHAFLQDMRKAIDRRVENKIASARRFAVRVRNHAKMVDCYLTTYYNHKGLFGNRKRVSDDIIERPQDYHIYEGLSTLTNISRYDLPDPDVYRDFFRLNPLYDFPLLSSTCTYFRGCPINRLDVAIAYDLPELVGKYHKGVEEALTQLNARVQS
ncbi:translation initiation factor IF-2 isoform X19 [Schistocerca serialis cubense]|uniref:translation initiation factor IF-2 isoform X19 n=1 Tax=Schistocerca serialis cubense TaxID=2023355 RepID=UPI00214EF7B5|nr:translation initiation factor IF-2 isoform X19 [Schistocerca serialis cubense]